MKRKIGSFEDEIIFSFVSGYRFSFQHIKSIAERHAIIKLRVSQIIVSIGLKFSQKAYGSKI